MKRLLIELRALFFITDKRTFFRYLTAIITSLPAIIKQGGLSSASQKMKGRKRVKNIEKKHVYLHYKT